MLFFSDFIEKQVRYKKVNTIDFKLEFPIVIKQWVQKHPDTKIIRNM